MTNLDAYMAYNSDGNIGLLSLELYSIDPTLTTDLQVSSAIGMIDKALSSDYKQHFTSETIAIQTRQYLIARGRDILLANGINFIQPVIGNKIEGGHW